MKRREFITVLGGTAVAWPLAARAQQAARVPRIGWIAIGTPQGSEFLRGAAFFLIPTMTTSWCPLHHPPLAALPSGDPLPRYASLRRGG